MKNYGNNEFKGVVSSEDIIVGYTTSVSGSGIEPDVDDGSYKLPYPIGTLGQGLVVRKNIDDELYLGFNDVLTASGSGTLVAGTIAVADTSITSDHALILIRDVPGGTLGHLSYVINPGVGYTINSTSATETSLIRTIPIVIS